MLKNIVPRTPVELIERSIDFSDNMGNGFSFDCDTNGKPVFKCEEAKRNYEYAMSHPELFTYEFNKLNVRRRTYIEPAHGTCSCGARVTLIDQYYGACACPKCNTWYNLFGQELIDPEYWND